MGKLLVRQMHGKRSTKSSIERVRRQKVVVRS